MDRTTAERWQVMSYLPEPELLAGAAWAPYMSSRLHCARAGETFLSRPHNVPEACGGAHAMQEWKGAFKFVLIVLAVAVVIVIILGFAPIF